MGEKTTFHAFLPAIQTAIKISGNADGARVQIDIPEQAMGEFAPVILMRGKAILVTVEVIGEKERQEYNRFG